LVGDLPNGELDAEAEAALEAVRTMPRGQEKTEALKKAGLLRNPSIGLGENWCQRNEIRQA
jgi:hypothetical protein